MKNYNKSKIILVLSLLTSATVLFGGVNKFFELRSKASEQKQISVVSAVISERVGQSFIEASSLPTKIKVDNKTYELQYSFNEKLSNYIEKLLKQYKTDYSSVVVIDNESGEILSAIGNDKFGHIDRALPFSSTHPSASLFKIITAADLLENTKVDEDSLFQYMGKRTTLYKYQLDEKKTKARWSRTETLKGAFAFSNNVIFGKAAINYLNDKSLSKMAVNFGFNSQLLTELPNVKSVLALPQDQYSLAEMASGFNTDTQISTVHGALLASVVANEGVLVKPKIISKVIDTSNQKNIWSETQQQRIILPETSMKLKDMMVSTVKKGTARGAFRRLPRKLDLNLVIGGKTGSITGGVPYGKRDWFTAFAMPAIGEEKGISICVMNINQKRWYIKSSNLAKSIIEYYYREVDPISPNVTQN